MPAELAQAWVAGVATLLSPCLLPLLPFAAAQGFLDRGGGLLAWSLAFAVTFAMTAASLGAALDWLSGLSAALRAHAVWAMLPVGLALIAAPRLAALRGGGLCFGALLGVLCAALWQPCAGRTLAQILGALAAGGPFAAGVAALGAYALGAALPLAALGFWLGVLARSSAGQPQRWAGLLLLGGSLALLLGIDVRLQVALSPYYPPSLP